MSKVSTQAFHVKKIEFDVSAYVRIIIWGWPKHRIRWGWCTWKSSCAKELRKDALGDKEMIFILPWTAAFSFYSIILKTKRTSSRQTDNRRCIFMHISKNSSSGSHRRNHVYIWKKLLFRNLCELQVYYFFKWL